MSELDKKLELAVDPLAESVRSWVHDQLDGTSFIEDELDSVDTKVQESVKQIKQAFIDEGWTQTLKAGDKTIVLNGKDPLGYIVYYPEVRLTGQEWYDRFVAEYHNKADWIAGDPEMGDDAESDVLLAAKLASGVKS